MDLWRTLTAVGITLVVVWLVAVVVLYRLGRRQGDQTSLRDALRLVPDVLRLLRRLAADDTLPRRVRVTLALLIVYLVLPIDLVPDFIPVAGYADDVILIALALRSVVRQSGVESLDRHWPGTPEGLRTIKQVCGLSVP